MLRCASYSPLTKCRLPGPQLPAHTANPPVNAASIAAANAAASSWRTCSHAMLSGAADCVGEPVEAVSGQSVNPLDPTGFQRCDDVVCDGNRPCAPPWFGHLLDSFIG